MKNVFIICCTSVLMLLSGCADDKAKYPFDVTFFNDGFKGITYTASDPTPVGSVDLDDWRSDGYWDWRYRIEPCGRASIPFTKQARIDTSGHEPGPIPTSFVTRPAYPNPFNPITSLSFTLPEECHVYASIINDRYQTVQVLACEYLDPGTYEIEWSAINSDNKELPSDIYRFIMLCTDANGNFLFASHGDLWLKN